MGIVIFLGDRIAFNILDLLGEARLELPKVLTGVKLAITVILLSRYKIQSAYYVINSNSAYTSL